MQKEKRSRQKPHRRQLKWQHVIKTTTREAQALPAATATTTKIAAATAIPTRTTITTATKPTLLTVYNKIVRTMTVVAGNIGAVVVGDGKQEVGCCCASEPSDSSQRQQQQQRICPPQAQLLQHRQQQQQHKQQQGGEPLMQRRLHLRPWPGQRSKFSSWLLTTVFIVAICLVQSAQTNSLFGNLQSCSNEGEEVQIQELIKWNSKCFKCACKNGFVNCDKESCPSIDDCYLLDPKTPDTCCRKCKGCIFRGVPYSSGTEWTDPEDPCKTYKCIASVVTETTMKCFNQCDDEHVIPPKPGECCPTCRGCKINGQVVAEGQEVVGSIDDRCMVCQCSKNKLTCAKKTCPILQCPISKQTQNPNECCPRCTEHREFMPVTGKCIFNNKVYYDKTQFTPDRCTNCTCSNGTSVCQRNTCPVLECSPEYQEMDGCCPHCITSEVRSECIHNGITYMNNETWNLGPCRSCRCTAGNIRCSEMRCAAVRCRSNEEKKTLPGECCPRCLETAGTCTVFGDPHFKTFDGKFFSFQGSCKYLLAADCRDHSFSIRLTNDGRGTKRSSWAKTVTLKMRGIRVNLGQKLRVKVNGSRVLLPYQGAADGPIISIERQGESILLRTDVGLNLEWDGNNFLQLTAPASFKQKLCGLCGNYNGIGRDDLTSRDGNNHTDDEVWRFANSWKVGGPKACSRRVDKLAARPNCKQRQANAYCRWLRESEVFGNCDNRLNPNNYFDACKMDVCECPNGLCHCDSFAAYAHECRRLGVQVPDEWRKRTRCPAGMWRRNATKIALPPWQYQMRGGGGAGGVSAQARRRKQQQQLELQLQLQQLQEQNNQLLLEQHVPKSLLVHKSPNRTPPPLH
ncbi:PREDICTED: BMP-binding endothelial regulator protein [Rhagoletis zephyria]|uniref:BMP-binding endothelial regulator protein n=1 Tax=Rhagoletis zephyria TaxID=28612 RepID=UPI00081143DB|nr:PREDICTED: BMP-binding endothelial regulator protein [Rhagoletis zephyria]XP_017477403.1 PREDICTED: BMP-binding endothelial regulator protein [Rhagoletis zephyria]